MYPFQIDVLMFVVAKLISVLPTTPFLGDKRIAASRN